METMTFEEARRFVAEASKAGSILGLESIHNLMNELSNVQDKLPIIHIAGTNGKGSVGAYLQAVFEKAGFTTARYSSPAVFDPLEVFTYCKKNIPESEYAHVMSQVKNACDILVSKGKPLPTVFEIETAAAFVWFYEKKPDIVLLEVGMGGETDATNIIEHPLASVITSISRDHMGFLGERVEEIAKVKAGIIKKGCPVFSAVQQASVAEVLRNQANVMQADFRMVEETECKLLEEQFGSLIFSYRGQIYGTQMAGLYQVKNAALAIEVAEYVLPVLMREKKVTGFVTKVIQDGIKEARWPGRFEMICKDPLVIIDGAHNEDAAKLLANTLQRCFPNQRVTFIIGVLADKEYKKMLEFMLPYADFVYTVTPDNVRALDAELLAGEVRDFLHPAEACDSMEEAIIKALAKAKERNEPVLAFGSLSYLGDLKKAMETVLERVR